MRHHNLPPQGFCVNVQVDDPGEAERIFRELSEGGAVQMPIGETFWARRVGMLIDRFGAPDGQLREDDDLMRRRDVRAVANHNERVASAL